jgi:hypothetical protein
MFGGWVRLRGIRRLWWLWAVSKDGKVRHKRTRDRSGLANVLPHGKKHAVRRVLHECYKRVIRVLHECYKSVTRLLQEHCMMMMTRDSMLQKR